MASPDPAIQERQYWLDKLGLSDDPNLSLSDLRERTGGGARVDKAANFLSSVQLKASLSDDTANLLTAGTSLRNALDARYGSKVIQDGLSATSADHENRLDSVESAWTLYVPTLTSTGVQPVLGVGSSTQGRYKQIGSTVWCKGFIIFGGSGFNFGTGVYNLSVPVAQGTLGTTSLGEIIINSGTGAWVIGWAPHSAGSLACNIYCPMSAANPVQVVVQGTSTPGGVAWGANAQIRWNLVYEV